MRSRDEILQSQDKRFFNKLQKETTMRNRRPLVDPKTVRTPPPLKGPKGGDSR